MTALTPARMTKNVNVDGHRTSMRLELEMWDALEDISMREGRTLNEICGLVHRRRHETSFTASMRVFIVAYYRAIIAGGQPLEAAMDAVGGGAA
jgi:predicted DNA-binding ribbon-helix-helix protein